MTWTGMSFHLFSFLLIFLLLIFCILLFSSVHFLFTSFSFLFILLIFINNAFRLIAAINFQRPDLLSSTHPAIPLNPPPKFFSGMFSFFSPPPPLSHLSLRLFPPFYLPCSSLCHLLILTLISRILCPRCGRGHARVLR